MTISTLLAANYNPDVLNCLANLSNDEVFTPPTIVNQMLDMLPQSLFRDPSSTFLDPACKSGVFLREIAKRLLVGLAPLIPDEQARRDHIFQHQLYGIAITELTSLLSRRSLYCSKYPNGKYSVSRFEDAEGNVRFRRVEHHWVNGKCAFCSASQSQYDRDKTLETHAYELIHTSRPEGIFGMKFDVIIGNPPYQLSDGGNSASASPLYHNFVEQAMKLGSRYLAMIIPARWYAGGKGLDDFRSNMLGQKHISNIVDIPNSADCFPGVNIAGGICYFLWRKDYLGDCEITNLVDGKSVSVTTRSLNEFPFFVRDNSAIIIIRKVLAKKEHLMSDFVKSRNYFSVPTTATGHETEKAGTVKTFTSKGIIYIRKLELSDKDNLLNSYKLIITYAMSGGNRPASSGNYMVVPATMRVLLPNEACSETYLIVGDFDSFEYAENLRTYVSTKFFRFLLLQALTSIHITKDKFCFVPQQDFSKPWTDAELYAKYGLTEEEIAFIESMIRPMDLTGGDDNG